MQGKGNKDKAIIETQAEAEGKERSLRLFLTLTSILTFFALLLSIITSCASIPKRKDYVAGYKERIIASWYGEEFHGRRTANGEIFDMYGLTAAHRIMPFDTYLLVTNRENGRSVKVKVNDRGPFVSGRSLDLSYGAAKRLDMVRTGTAEVDIEIIRSGESQKGIARFTIQVGAFSIEENAVKLKKRLADNYNYKDIRIIPYETNSKRYLRVRIGSFPSEGDAVKISKKLKSKEGLDGFVVRDD